MESYAFVDMHVHTVFSDEELCDVTVEEILKSCQERAQKVGKDCVIAISDHNTILGVRRAREILNSDTSGKYKNVKLINGIEITTDLNEMTDYFAGEKIFTRCHTLAYGYDENNKELIAYSKITHMNYSNLDNVGMQICASRRAVNDVFNINIPFTEFEKMTQLPKSANFREEFIKIAYNYVKEHKLKIRKTDIFYAVEPYILDYADFVRESCAKGRLLLSEAAKMVTEAGGELVLAHPSVLKVTAGGIQFLADKHKLTAKDICSVSTKKSYIGSELGLLDKQELVLNEFIDAFESVAKCKLSGIEKFYSSNFNSRLDHVVELVCKKRGLYETAGSDYHGENFHSEAELGNVFSKTNQDNYKEIYESDSEVNKPMHITSLAACEHFLNDRQAKLDNYYVVSNSKEEPINKKDLEILFNVSTKRRVAQSVIKTTTYDTKEKINLTLEARLEELSQIAQKLNEVVQKRSDPKKQAKAMLRLNLFVENVINAMISLQAKASKDLQILENPNYKKFTDLKSELSARFKSLIRNNSRLIKDLHSDMVYYYKKKEVAVMQLANLNYREPIEKPATTSSTKEAATSSKPLSAEKDLSK